MMLITLIYADQADDKGIYSEPDAALIQTGL